MLGLSNGLMYPKYNFEKEVFLPLSPNEIQSSTSHSCLMWYDFSDTSTMYTDAGSTNVSSDNDLIYRITNKSAASGGDRLTTYLQQTTSSLRPAYKTAGYASFSGDYIGGQRDDSGTAVGNAGTNCFSNKSGVEADELSIFIVANMTTHNPSWLAPYLDMFITHDSSQTDEYFRYFNMIAQGANARVANWMNFENRPNGEGDTTGRIMSDLGYGTSNVESNPDRQFWLSDAINNSLDIKMTLTSPNAIRFATGDHIDDNTVYGTYGLGDPHEKYYRFGTGSDGGGSMSHDYNIAFNKTSGENVIVVGAVAADLAQALFHLSSGWVKHVIIMEGDMYSDDTYKNLVEYLKNN